MLKLRALLADQVTLLTNYRVYERRSMTNYKTKSYDYIMGGGEVNNCLCVVG